MTHGPALYRYASERADGEGCRIGVARHLPRGVRREDWSRRGHFDVWLPLLAPSAGLVKEYLADKITWSMFSRRYRAEMKKPECRQVIGLLAVMSCGAPFSLGCFCEDESRCHRSVLRELVIARRAVIAPDVLAGQAGAKTGPVLRFASPVCYADWDERDKPA